MAFESLWGDFEPFLDTLGHLWVFFFGIQNRTFVRHWSNMGSKRPFGLILVEFGEDLDASWENLGFQN